jgi:hypothetical protein
MTVTSTKKGARKPQKDNKKMKYMIAISKCLMYTWLCGAKWSKIDESGAEVKALVRKISAYHRPEGAAVHSREIPQ